MHSTRVLMSFWLCAAALVVGTRAELSVPSPLVPLVSVEGEETLLHAKYVHDAFVLLENFVSQINDAYCGIASTAMVLNSLGVGQPLQDSSTGLNITDYSFYDQVNAFNSDTELVKTVEDIRNEGLSLAELSGFLAAHPGVNSTYRYSTDIGLEQFRDLMVSALAQPNTFVIVNFNRHALQERGWGHHSPIGAYNAEKDCVLVLDVSRYKYPAWWVSVPSLYQATLPWDDTDSERGLAFVWAPADAPPLLGKEFITANTDDGDVLLSLAQEAGSTAPQGTWVLVSLALLGGAALAGTLLGGAAKFGLVTVSWRGGRGGKYEVAPACDPGASGQGALPGSGGKASGYREVDCELSPLVGQR